MSDKTNHTRNRIAQEAVDRKDRNDRKKNQLAEEKSRQAVKIAEQRSSQADDHLRAKIESAEKKELFKANVARANLDAKLQAQTNTAISIQKQRSETDLVKQDRQNLFLEIENERNRAFQARQNSENNQHDRDLRVLDSNLRIREKDVDFRQLKETTEIQHNHEKDLQEDAHLQQLEIMDRETYHHREKSYIDLDIYREKEKIDTREMSKRTNIEIRKDSTRAMFEIFRDEAQGEMKKQILVLEGRVKEKLIKAETEKEKDILWTEAAVKIYLTRELGRVVSDDDVSKYIKENMTSWNQELDD